MDEWSDKRESGFPKGVKLHEQRRFGFAVTVPRRFILLANTADPVARSLRGPDPDPRHEVAAGRRWPEGFCDPEVLRLMDGGRVLFLRTLEFDTLRRDEPMDEQQASVLWFGIREAITRALASGGLPGYSLLDVRDATVGPLPALAFEYRWDGIRVDNTSGERALLVWAISLMRLFHLYYHCPADEWEARLPEFEEILGSFELVEEAA